MLQMLSCSCGLSVAIGANLPNSLLLTGVPNIEYSNNSTQKKIIKYLIPLLKFLMNTKKDIRQLSITDLQLFFEEIEEPAFRAKQVYQWLWQKSCLHFNEMTNLPLSVRTKLQQNFEIPTLSIHHRQDSKDGTVKLRFQLCDGNKVEGVLIPVPEEKRMTACISSQVGCSLSCAFCATGFLKRERNLYTHEIYDQVVLINNIAQQKFAIPLTNIVFMGMGEPLLNYKNVLHGIQKITGEMGLGMASKRITVSTAGIAKMIHQLAEDEVKFNLALSLHAPNDAKRNEIMPINQHNSLQALARALKHFKEKNKRSNLTYEYILLNEFNDTEQDALELVKWVKKVPAKINIIEYNKVEGTIFEKASNQRLHNFINVLVKNELTVTVRKSRGEDIDAACGQLANKSI